MTWKKMVVVNLVKHAKLQFMFFFSFWKKKKKKKVENNITYLKKIVIIKSNDLLKRIGNTVGMR